MLIMKHKKDLISESEKRARGMVDNLSEKLRCLQVIICAASKFPFILCIYIMLVSWLVKVIDYNKGLCLNSGFIV